MSLEHEASLNIQRHLISKEIKTIPEAACVLDSFNQNTSGRRQHLEFPQSKHPSAGY